MNFLLVTLSCIIASASALRWGMIGSGVENVKRFQHSYGNKSNLYVILPSNSVRMYFFQIRFANKATICERTLYNVTYVDTFPYAIETDGRMNVWKRTVSVYEYEKKLYWECDMFQKCDEQQFTCVHNDHIIVLFAILAFFSIPLWLWLSFQTLTRWCLCW
mgnify:FL=1